MGRVLISKVILNQSAERVARVLFEITGLILMNHEQENWKSYYQFKILLRTQRENLWIMAYDPRQYRTPEYLSKYKWVLILSG